MIFKEQLGYFHKNMQDIFHESQWNNIEFSLLYSTTIISKILFCIQCSSMKNKKNAKLYFLDELISSIEKIKNRDDVQLMKDSD